MRHLRWTHSFLLPKQLFPAPVAANNISSGCDQLSPNGTPFRIIAATLVHSSPSRLEFKVPVIWHYMIRKNTTWIPNKPFGENVFKSFVIAILMENKRTSIPSIQGMVDRVLLVSTFRAAHLRTLPDFKLAVKSPDTFSSVTPFLLRRLTFTITTEFRFK